MNGSFWKFTPSEQLIVKSLLDKGRREQQLNDRFAIIAFPEFFALFTPEEVKIMQKFLDIDPASIDYRYWVL